jgi:hypothetical protein
MNLTVGGYGRVVRVVDPRAAYTRRSDGVGMGSYSPSSLGGRVEQRTKEQRWLPAASSVGARRRDTHA